MIDDKIKIECIYLGTSTNKNGVTTIKFEAPYDQAMEYIKLHMYFGTNLHLGYKSDTDEKFIKIGQVRINGINCKKEGNSILSFYGEGLELPALGNVIERQLKIMLVYKKDDA